ncbi:MAG: AAA family ATPase [Lysobacteraceae bacterium]
MYLPFYGLNAAPFAITPDPRFVFLSERHRDALAHLLYGIGQGGSGGFVQLTGEVGTGKTTLCRLLLEQLPENTRVALILNPRLSPVELLEAIGEELHLDLDGARGSLKALVDRLNSFLLSAYAQGLRVVLIIDEAQNLSFDALEQVRLLTNLETATQKLLQIILLGQPELRDMLAREDLRQLAQRITARFHLTPLSEAETEAYLRHRLAVAGAARFPFTRLAVRRIHHHAQGVPRLINVIADRALMAGYVQEELQIGERSVDRAAREALASPMRRAFPWLAAVGALALLALSLWWWSQRDLPASPATTPVDAVEDAPAVSSPNGGHSAPLDSVALHDLAAANGRESRLAWRRLLALWKLSSDLVNVPTAQRCAPQLAPGIYCLRSSGSLGKLAKLDRPVLLHLTLPEGDAWAVLLGIGESQVRLWIGGERVNVARNALEDLWLGEFQVLWVGDVALSGVLRRGDTGAGVDALARLLRQQNMLRGTDTGPWIFDAAMESAVRRLQMAHGLIPDGIAGPETLLAAQSREQAGPHLRKLD